MAKLPETKNTQDTHPVAATFVGGSGLSAVGFFTSIAARGLPNKLGKMLVTGGLGLGVTAGLSATAAATYGMYKK